MSGALRGLAAAVAVLGLAGAANAADVGKSAPIVGTWRFELPNFCAETYRMRADGTLTVNSGEETTEEEYEISGAESARGFYRFTSRVVRTNGRPDCTGTPSKAGSETTLFIRFHPSGDMMLFCTEETPDSCVGPLMRVPDESA